MTFEEKIRNRYQQESDHRAPKEGWESFVAFRAGRKKKSRRFIFFFLLFGLLLSVTVISQQSTIKNADLHREASAVFIDTLDLQDIKPETIISSIEKPAPTNTIQSSKIPHKYQEQGRGGEQEKPMKSKSGAHIEGVALNNNSVDNTAQSYAAQRKMPRIQMRTLDIIAKEVKLIPSLRRNIRGVHIAVDPKETLWSPGAQSIEGYAGLAFPFQLETVDEQAHQIGLKYMRAISRRIRWQVSAEYAVVNFKSNVFDRALGIAAVEAPAANYSFQDVIIESVNTSLFIGVDALVFNRGPWQGHLGLAYGASAELVKDADYAFVQDDGGDDFILSVSDSKKYFEPMLLRFESGLYYQTSVGGFGVSLRYPWQFAKRHTQLLRQVQLNFGMTYKFN